MIETKTHSGYVAVIGRSNVGKSTLLNFILNKKISIVSRKPQATRNKILGIDTIDNFQSIYIDTPGLHSNHKNILSSYMNKTALNSLLDADIIIFVVAGTIWNKEDELVLKSLKKIDRPIILVINKVDLVKQKTDLLKCIESFDRKAKFVTIIPLSAKDGTNVSLLKETVRKLLPEGPFFFDDNQKTDKDDKFLISEIIREQLMRFLGQELPYSACVIIDKVEIKNKIIHIVGTIYVERPGQKAIVIGKKADVLKKIGIASRKNIEKILGQKVFLQLWVKVKSGWTDDKNILKQFGYNDY